MTLFTPGIILAIPPVTGPITFQWNPQQIEGPSADANWVPIQVAGRELPYYDYTSGGDSVIAFTLGLSKFNRGDGHVRSMIDRLVSLTTPVIGTGKKHPPEVIVRLGVRRWKCITKSVSPSTGANADPFTLDPYDGKVNLSFLRVQ